MKENLGILIEKWLIKLGLGMQAAEAITVIIILVSIVIVG
jgi:hypothetical protein